MCAACVSFIMYCACCVQFFSQAIISMLQTCRNLVQSSIARNAHGANHSLSHFIRRFRGCKNKITHCVWLRSLSGTMFVRNRPNLARDDPPSSEIQSDKLSTESNQATVNDLKSEETSVKEHGNYYNALEKPVDLPAEYKSPDIGFWESERGLVLKDQIFTGVGRVLRMFISKERSDNWYESAMAKEYYR